MKVEEGLKVDEPSSEEMLRLLEDSTEFDLDLPQIPLLHEVSLAGGGSKLSWHVWNREYSLNGWLQSVVI